MSFQNKNLFALLGNDVNEPADEIIATKEVVKKQTSNKKADIAPKSDKTRARKNGKPSVTGNEAGAKYVNKNNSVEGPRSTSRKTGKDKKFDKHSRTGRSETRKSQSTKLGDEAEAQVEGAQDAEEEIENVEEEEEEEEPVLRSVEDYFKELELQHAQLGSKPKSVAVDSKLASAEKIVKEREIFIEATSVKKTKSKAKKEKIYLDVDIKVASPSDRPPRRDNGPRPSRGGRGARGSARGARGRGGRGARGERAPKDAKPTASTSAFDESKFPAL